MAPQTSMLHIRVDDDIKEEATQTLAAVGMTMSEAVRYFLHRVVVEQGFPLDLKIPNAETRAAIDESRSMMKAKRARFATPEALFDDLEKKRVK